MLAFLGALALIVVKEFVSTPLPRKAPKTAKHGPPGSTLFLSNLERLGQTKKIFKFTRLYAEYIGA